MRYWYAPLRSEGQGPDLFTTSGMTDPRDKTGDPLGPDSLLYIGELTKDAYDRISRNRANEANGLDEFGLPLPGALDEFGLPL